MAKFDVVGIISSGFDSEDFIDDGHMGARRVRAGSLREGDILASSLEVIIDGDYVREKIKVMKILWKDIPPDAVKFFSPLKYKGFLEHGPLDCANKSENSNENCGEKFDLIEFSYLNNADDDEKLIGYAQPGSFKMYDIREGDHKYTNPRWQVTDILKNVSSDVAKCFLPCDRIFNMAFLNYDERMMQEMERDCSEEEVKEIEEALKKRRRSIENGETNIEEIINSKRVKTTKDFFTIKGIIRFIILAIITFIGAVIGDNIVMDTGLWEVIGEFTGVWLGAIIGVAVGNWLLYRGAKNDKR